MKPHLQLACTALACMYTGALLAGVSLRIEDVNAVPETPRLPVGVFAVGTGSISTVSVDITYPKTDLQFVQAALASGLLAGGTAQVTLTDGNPERATAAITVTMPVPVALPAGETRLFDAVLSLGSGLIAGDVYPITLARAPRVTLDGVQVEAAVGDEGGVTVATGNYLILENAWGYPGQSRIPVELKVYNSDPLMGMQVGGTFDRDVLTLVDISQENTMTEALGCEFFQPVIDNESGYFLLGVLLDAMAPADLSKRYAASGSRLRVARLRFDVDAGAREEQDVALKFENGLGSPPIENRVVVDNQSSVPSFLDGTFRVGKAPMFLRGEVNSDNRVNIADPVMITLYLFKGYPIKCVKSADVNDDGEVRLDDVMYLLHYLFLSGRVIPPPFPTPGLDPTDDKLSCEGR